jgi:hypothetical protein
MIPLSTADWRLRSPERSAKMKTVQPAMTRTGTCSTADCNRRSPDVSVLSSLSTDDLMEEVRQLRAALAVYRKLVERLIQEKQAA